MAEKKRRGCVARSYQLQERGISVGSGAFNTAQTECVASGAVADRREEEQHARLERAAATPPKYDHGSRADLDQALRRIGRDPWSRSRYTAAMDPSSP